MNYAQAEIQVTRENPPIEAAQTVLPMDVTINSVKNGTWLFIERSDSLYVQSEALTEWRVMIEPNHKSIMFKDQAYLPLSGVPGYTFKVDLANQAVAINFSPSSFSETNISETLANRAMPNQVLPSVFINYDINYSKSFVRRKDAFEDLSALTEIGYSSEAGVLTNSASILNLTNDRSVGKGMDVIRLETTFTKDFGDQNNSLLIGDTNTRVGLLGRNVYYGGIRFGTNFALTPGYVSQPLPVINGLSAAPSTVELYVNDVLRQTSNVPAGPFSIKNFPTLTGSGDVRVVVKDLLGRETVFQQSFFTNGMLLAKGLSDWSVEAGKIRQNLGLDSFNYASEFMSGLWRNGLTKTLTLEARGAITRQLNLFELGATSKMPLNSLGRFAIADSHEDTLGNGSQWLASLEHQHVNYGAYLEVQGATKQFRDLGQEFLVNPVKQQISGNLNYNHPYFGNFGFGFAKIDQYNNPSVETISANYSRRLGKGANINAHISEAFANNITSQSIGVNVVFDLGHSRLASLYASSNGQNNDLFTTYSQSPSLENKFGFHALMGSQQNLIHDEAGVYYAGQRGTLSADLSASDQQTAVRLGGNGGLIFTNSQWFATQKNNSGFVLAEVKDYANVGVGTNSNMLVKTDDKGIALIPNIAPYQKNYILLNAQDLPISAEIESIELEAVPKWRSGVKVSFPVRLGRGALIKIKLENGEPAPSGATVHIKGDQEIFYVARRGEAFVTGLKTTNELVMQWTAANKTHQCQLTATLPNLSVDEITRLGPIDCKEF